MHVDPVSPALPGAVGCSCAVAHSAHCVLCVRLLRQRATHLVAHTADICSLTVWRLDVQDEGVGRAGSSEAGGENPLQASPPSGCLLQSLCLPEGFSPGLVHCGFGETQKDNGMFLGSKGLHPALFSWRQVEH